LSRRAVAARGRRLSGRQSGRWRAADVVQQQRPDETVAFRFNIAAMSIIVRKLRLQRGWTQEDLARFAGLSVRSIQRIERGQPGSLETMKALAAVFETDVSTLGNGGLQMNDSTVMPADEKEALEYVARIKGFYMHLFMFALFAIVFLGTFGFTFGFERPQVRWLLFAFAGWAIGVVIHGLHAYEVIDLVGPNWERRLIERRLGRKLN
jgi:transcriptional regulator with XRE-family HTH domain